MSRSFFLALDFVQQNGVLEKYGHFAYSGFIMAFLSNFAIGPRLTFGDFCLMYDCSKFQWP